MFHEIRFPTAIAFHSHGGPERKTEIVTLGSGYEERNGVWAASPRRYDVGYGIKSLDDIHTVLAFFEARGGRLYGFRFKDFADFKSCSPGAVITPLDQTLATGDGSSKSFSLIKTYQSGPSSYIRSITKPVSGSLRVALAAAETSDFVLDSASGVITFSDAPPSGAVITAGFAFDVPVRFDTDSLSINLAGFAAGEIPAIPLIEIRI